MFFTNNKGICVKILINKHLYTQLLRTISIDSHVAITDSIKDIIIYNTVLNANKTNLNRFKAKKAINKRQEAIKAIQPLPLSLKYINEKSEVKSDRNINKVNNNDGIKKVIYFPYRNDTSDSNRVEISAMNESVGEYDIKDKPERINKEIRSRNEDFHKWMNAYDNLECDLTESCEEIRINYGTPDPSSDISNVPCGGCGALLHCKDTSIPGYIPSEIYKNCSKEGASDLESIMCQRCFFLREHNVALQVRVSSDDYPKILTTIRDKKSLVLLIIDLLDFPCSIWPGIADILGPKTPIFIVGNKADLLPKDDKRYLENVRKILYEEVKISGFATTRILNVNLVSAKTGYGVEELITSLQRLWQVKDVYLVGCTNVGKSTLFNALLKSDYCKYQVSDLIQRATTSQWPGTTLNLLKFPIMRTSRYRIQRRMNRLIETNKRLLAEEERRAELLKSKNTPENANLMGLIERTFPSSFGTSEKFDCFDQKPTVIESKGLKEYHPDYSSGRWCYDTPGVVHPDQILDLLTLDELVLTLPRELIRPETFCIKQGCSLFIGGLGRLDYISGDGPIRLTVFRSNELPITVCQTKEADKIYDKCLGTDLMLVPMGSEERLSKWPGLKPHKKIAINCVDRKYASKDIVLSNSGWISINCSNKEHIFLPWTPQGRGIHVRDAILPKSVALRGKRIRNSIAYEPHKFI